ncbi:MAG: glycosyltransferase family 2 protein, partial [Desulfovibrionales bacterium]|nr:glycosyltransferase family 2 protein [Desulfovibrionales bacterium]
MIIFPMAGLSSRFFKAGYTQPKYMLTAHGRPLFDFAVGGFSHYFDAEPFIFICRQDHDTPAFVQERCRALGIKTFKIIPLNAPTRGQAETVALGLESHPHSKEALTIFNIDTFRPGYRHPDLPGDCAGYLEVFEGGGDNWSYVAPGPGMDVLETAEKNPISNLCSTGLYHFSRAEDFLWAFKKEAAKPRETLTGNELYIAPMYNSLIAQGKRICYHCIPARQAIFCGVPKEYQE